MAETNVTLGLRSAKEKFLLYYQKVMTCNPYCSVPITSTLKTGFQAVSNGNLSLVPVAQLSKFFTLNHLIRGFLSQRRRCYG